MTDELRKAVEAEVAYLEGGRAPILTLGERMQIAALLRFVADMPQQPGAHGGEGDYDMTRELIRAALMAVNNALGDVAKPYPTPDENLVTNVAAESLLWASANTPLIDAAAKRLEEQAKGDTPMPTDAAGVRNYIEALPIRLDNLPRLFVGTTDKLMARKMAAHAKNAPDAEMLGILNA